MEKVNAVCACAWGGIAGSSWALKAPQSLNRGVTGNRQGDASLRAERVGVCQAQAWRRAGIGREMGRLAWLDDQEPQTERLPPTPPHPVRYSARWLTPCPSTSSSKCCPAPVPTRGTQGGALSTCSARSGSSLENQRAPLPDGRVLPHFVADRHL